MIQFNFFAILIAALVPFVIGFISYNPKFLGNAWMRESGVTEEKMKKANVGLIFLFTIILSLLISFFMQFLTIHQYGASGMIGGDETLAKPSYFAFMKDYGMAYRCFGHGALHGFIATLFLIFPLFAINALFERKSWKYIFINAGYWAVTLTIMGGIICGWYAADGFNWVTQK